MSPSIIPVCFECAHYGGGSTYACAAFPDGIPDEILVMAFDHSQPWPSADDPQDNGIRFEPIGQRQD